MTAGIKTSDAGNALEFYVGATKVGEISETVASLPPLDNQFGVEQAWVDVTASRSAGVTYTNTTGKSILVSIASYPNGTGLQSLSFTVDGIILGRIGQVSSGSPNTVVQSLSTFVVPNGSTYGVSVFSGTPVLSIWSELR